MINKKGITIIELVIAMTIVSILWTIWFLSLKWWTASARDSVRIDHIWNISTAIDLYKVDRSSYPEPTNPVDITYSWATVWTQWGFWKDTARQTGRIFWDFQDPTYDIDYTYSVTNSRQEFQLAYVLEDPIDNLASAVDITTPDLIPTTYATGDFSPIEFNPIIWLDGEDIDGDGDNTDNPSNNSNVSAWINKSTAWNTNNPTFTDGDLKYSTNGFYGSYPWVFIANNKWLRLNNSAISQGDIFYVVQNNDPFSGTDKNGRWLQWTSWNYLIWYWKKNRNSIYINNSPAHHNSSPATSNNRTAQFIYWYHTNTGNYSFRDTGTVLAQWAANSISGIEWWFNKAWAWNERADFVVSEILIFSSSLSASEREKVEWYLAHKWWQSYWLPSNHPYKNAPPEWWTPPPPPDTDPDAFSFNAVTDASLSAEFTSNTITVTGINTSTAISITTPWTYSINGWSYTSAPSTVNENDTVAIRQLSSASNSTTVTSTLTIWSLSNDFAVTTLDGDTTPDPFSFNAVSNSDINTQYTSNSISISGINTSVPIAISWWDAQYKISDWVPYDITGSGTASASNSYGPNPAGYAFDNNMSANWWWNEWELPSSLTYDLWSGNQKIVSKYTLYRDSSQSGGFWWIDWLSPRDWTLQWSNNGTSWTILDSRTNEYIHLDQTKKEFTFSNTTSYRYYRINITQSVHSSYDWVNITEMELIDEGWSWVFVSTPSSVENGDIVEVKMTSASSPNTTETWTLTVWSASEDFTITTLAPDTIPDNFSFTDVEDANLGVLYTSNTVTISWINTGTWVTISGVWEYNINGWTYTTWTTTINNWDNINIRQSSSSSNSITTSSILSIGWVNATYNVTTPAPPPDSVPDSFSFIDVADATPGTEYVSNDITISWINADASVQISWWQYSINWEPYKSWSGSVSNWDSLVVKNNSAPNPWNTTNATVTIWWISDTYSITTVAADDVPDTYVLWYVSEAILNKTYNSNPITVSWINVGTTIDVTWGGWKYNINGWSWQSWAGTVYNGDIVIVHLQSLASGNTNVSTELDIGWVKATFDITTLLDPDDSPDVFTFNDVVDANLNTLYSADITVSWINTGTWITISWAWQYSINWWSYTSSDGTVYNWDTVSVRQTSSAAESDSVNSTVVIGNVSDIFTVTTTIDEPELASIIEREPSNVYVRWNFNGLFAHGVSSTNNHYVFITPSIITTDTSNTNFLDVINDKKFVYTGYDNYPATYTNADDTLTSTWWFDQYRISGPIIFDGAKEDLASYAWIKQVDNGVRSTYRTTELYRQSAKYLDNHGTGYVEEILGNIIGINPIKPYYCSDILDKEFTENIALGATITATANTTWWWVTWTWGISNGIKSTIWNSDYEYHSDTTNAFIDFEWQEDKPIGFIRIYNRTGCCSSRLSWATVSLYDKTNTLLYTHTLWDTTNDYVVDLDLEWIGKLYENVRKITIRSQWSNSYLNLREVEVFVWWTIKDGTYLVDSDGVWGKKPYEVYCDMTTDGGWWTKIGDNYVINWEFSDGQHAFDYPSSTANWNRENNVVLLNNPSDNSYAMLQKAVYWANSNIDYDIIFNDFATFEAGNEIRLSAWVADAWDEWDSIDGWKWYIFRNRLTYTDATYVENGERTTLDTQVVDGKTWKLQMVRIPITKEVQSFVWQVGNGTETSASRAFYFADLKAEIYYK